MACAARAAAARLAGSRGRRGRARAPRAAAAARLRGRGAGAPPALGEAGEGRAFLLQAGDCAESFRQVSAVAIRERLKVLLQMSAVLTYGATLPVVKVGRIAGQFTKPRTSLTERVGGVDLPSFRGHAIHSDAPTPEARVPDPERMVQAYYQAVSTLNLLRAFTKGGFADLTQVHTWNQEFVSSSLEGRRYEVIANEIGRALRFMQAIGIDLGDERHDPRGRRLDEPRGAPARLRGAARPPGLDDGRLVRLLGALPLGGRADAPVGRRARRVPRRCREPGRREDRAGRDAGRGGRALRAAQPRAHPRAPHVRRPARRGPRERGSAAARARRARERVPVLWACDPMHANTFVTPSGHKTRRFDDVLAEIEGFFAAHREVGSWPGGVHLEITGEDVTECLGGSEEVLEEQLDHRYETLCDPRLNARQSLDLAFRVAELMRAA